MATVLTGEIIPTRPVKKIGNSSSLCLTSGERSLSKKQKLFVENYIQTGNAYKAAKAAGYTEQTALVASVTVLQTASVMREMKRRTEQYVKDLEISTDTVLYEAYNMATANMLDYIDVQNDGTFKVDLKKVSRAQGAAIQELSYDVQGRPRIRLVDKKAAVELLAKIKKMFDDDEPESRGHRGPLTIQEIDTIVQNVTINQVNAPSGHVQQVLP